MAHKRILPRTKALEDTDEAIHYYLKNASPRIALGFIDALEKAYAHIGRHPSSGSLRYAYELSMPGLRSWPLKRHPYLVFYIETTEHIEIWRLLHQERDIPAWMQSPE